MFFFSCPVLKNDERQADVKPRSIKSPETRTKCVTPNGPVCDMEAMMTELCDVRHNAHSIKNIIQQQCQKEPPTPSPSPSPNPSLSPPCADSRVQTFPLAPCKVTLDTSGCGKVVPQRRRQLIAKQTSRLGVTCFETNDMNTCN